MEINVEHRVQQLEQEVESLKNVIQELKREKAGQKNGFLDIVVKNEETTLSNCDFGPTSMQMQSSCDCKKDIDDLKVKIQWLMESTNSKDQPNKSTAIQTKEVIAQVAQVPDRRRVISSETTTFTKSAPIIQNSFVAKTYVADSETASVKDYIMFYEPDKTCPSWLKCKLCPRVFKEKNIKEALSMHIRAHKQAERKQAESHECSYCKEAGGDATIYRDRAALRRHCIQHHPHLPAPAISDDEGSKNGVQLPPSYLHPKSKLDNVMGKDVGTLAWALEDRRKRLGDGSVILREADSNGQEKRMKIANDNYQMNPYSSEPGPSNVGETIKSEVPDDYYLDRTSGSTGTAFIMEGTMLGMVPKDMPYGSSTASHYVPRQHNNSGTYINADVVLSSKGRRLLYDWCEFEYRARIPKSDEPKIGIETIKLRCTDPGCNVNGRLSRELIVSCVGEHNHPPPVGKRDTRMMIEKGKTETRMKKAKPKKISGSPSKKVSLEYGSDNGAPCHSDSSFGALDRTLPRETEILGLRVFPFSGWNENLSQDYVVLETISGLVCPDENCRVFFSHKRRLQELSEHDKWCVVSTYSRLPDGFQQLLTIGYVVGVNLFVPCVWALMPSNTEAEYIIVFSWLRSNITTPPASLSCDFEHAITNAFISVFPEAVIHRSMYHYSQSVWTSLVECKMEPNYVRGSETFKIVRWLFVLPFLTPDEVQFFFRIIYDYGSVNEPKLKVFLQKFYHTFVEHGTAKYPPEEWSVNHRIIENANVCNNLMDSYHNTAIKDLKKGGSLGDLAMYVRREDDWLSEAIDEAARQNFTLEQKLNRKSNMTEKNKQRLATYMNGYLVGGELDFLTALSAYAAK